MRQPPSPCPLLLPARGRAGSRAEGPELCRSRAELLRGGSDGCAETGLPWKSSSLSGSAVTAPMVRRGGRLRFGAPVGSDAAGSLPGAGGVWRLRRALQAEVGSVFVPGSIESSWLRHTQPRARRPRRAGARAGDGTEGAGVGRGILGWGTPSARAGPCGWWWGAVPICPSIVGLECPSLRGWEERHRAPLPAAARASQAGGTACTRSPLLFACAGTTPPGAPRSFACACSDGSRRAHPSCGSRVVEKGGHPGCPPLSQSRVLVLPSGMELWGCSLWLGFRLASSPPEQRPPARPLSEPGATRQHPLG